MKCDPEAAIKRRIAAELTETLDTQRTTAELMTIIVLHDVFGFGTKRLKQFTAALQKQYDDFTAECDLTDTMRRGSQKATNFDTAIIRAVQALRSYGIDYRDVLGDIAQILVTGSDGKPREVTEFIQTMERKVNDENK